MSNAAGALKEACEIRILRDEILAVACRDGVSDRVSIQALHEARQVAVTHASRRWFAVNAEDDGND